MKTLFYILIPVYNVEMHLCKCLNSILNQTYQNFKVILVNDGSTDGSGAICDEFAAKHKNIHVIHQENQGQIAARGAAERFVLKELEYKNSFIVYVDSDDTIENEALEKLDAIIGKYDPDMIIYNFKKVTLDGKTVVEQSNSGSIELITDKRELYRRITINDAYNSLCRKAINARIAEVVDHREHYKIRFGEDLIRSLDYLRNATSVVFYDQILYNYLVNAASVTHTVSADNYKIDTTVRKLVLEFLKEENLFDENDYNDYWKFIQKLLFGEIVRIAYMKISMNKKIDFYNELYENEIWNSCLNVDIQSSVVELFIKRKFKTILFIYKIRRFLSKVKHLIKK